MSDTLERVRRLAASGEVRISDHGYDEIAEEGLTARELVSGLASATIVEDYPAYPKGPCVLLLQTDVNGEPVHVVWGIPKGHVGPAVLITAYRPDPARWDDAYTERRT